MCFALSLSVSVPDVGCEYRHFYLLLCWASVYRTHSCTGFFLADAVSSFEGHYMTHYCLDCCQYSFCVGEIYIKETNIYYRW